MTGVMKIQVVWCVFHRGFYPKMLISTTDDIDVSQICTVKRVSKSLLNLFPSSSEIDAMDERNIDDQQT